MMSPSFYLLEVGSHDHKIHSTEAKLRDDKKDVYYHPGKDRESERHREREAGQSASH